LCIFAKQYFLQKTFKEIKEPLHPSSSKHHLEPCYSLIHQLGFHLGALFSQSISHGICELELDLSWLSRFPSSIHHYQPSLATV
jgi:hypothetical protein